VAISDHHCRTPTLLLTWIPNLGPMYDQRLLGACPLYFCLAPVPLTAVLAPSLWLWLARATSNGFNSSLLKSLLQPIISHGSFSWAALPRFSWAPLPPSHVLAPSLKRKKPRLHLSASFLIPLIVHGCTTRIPQGFAPAPDRPPCHCALTCGSSPVAMPVAVAVSVAVRLPLPLCAHLWPQGV